MAARQPFHRSWSWFFGRFGNGRSICIHLFFLLAGWAPSAVFGSKVPGVDEKTGSEDEGKCAGVDR